MVRLGTKEPERSLEYDQNAYVSTVNYDACTQATGN